ncbi:SPFH domain / Band 7 family protein [Xenorhabdus miraniensis]|uniref:SPFH domain / Band 7 family protein n=2 Tax=Xenorhabdus miraniensis TaxID=351674 RepID=A0A2D0JX37_9GAMM|nr:SPFH domain / Band 7 family protein [Xenorhabdus miraniensis]
MMKKIKILQGQIGLLAKEGEYQKVLTAGEYRFYDWFNKLELKVFSLNGDEIETKLAEHLRQYHVDWVEQHCDDIQFAEDEIGLLYEHDLLTEIIPPAARRLYWKNDRQRRIEIRKATEQRISPELLALLQPSKVRKRSVKGLDGTLIVQIPAWHIGVLIIDGMVQQLLQPGLQGYWCFGHHVEVEIIDTRSQALVEEDLAEHLRQHHSDWVEQYCDDIQIADDEMGLLYEHDVLVEILSPATRCLYWKNGNSRRVEVHKSSELEVSSELVSVLSSSALRQRRVKGWDSVLITQIPAWHVGILKVDGVVQALLPPGLKGYWRIGYDVTVETVDIRLQALEVSGQEILTRDKVNLRINLSANWRYHDVLLAYEKLSEPVAYLYRELQFTLREIVGTRSLDELLENKQVIDELVNKQIQQVIHDFGLEVASLGVKDIILPGDMKAILSQVVEAEKSAQANVIRRREETAATRSLLNTAKVMENNPIALRLKELETLESIAERINQISVYGGLDQVLNGLVQIKGEQK